MVPLLVRAQTEDADGGEAYTRRLLTVGGRRAAGRDTALAMARRAAAHPALPRPASATAQPRAGHRLRLPAAAADLLLRHGRAARGDPEHPRGVRPVRLGAGAQQRRRARRARRPSRLARRDRLDPVRLGEPKLLVLGIGTTLGIVVQALVLMPGDAPGRLPLPPALGLGPAAHRGRRARRSGSSATCLIGQVGYIVTTRVAADADRRQRRDLRQRLAAAPGAVRRPRRLAAHRADAPDEPRRRRGRHRPRSSPTSRWAARLSAVPLLPVSALLTVFGPQLGIALFALGAGQPRRARPGSAPPWPRLGVRPAAVRGDDAAAARLLRDDRQPHPRRSSSSSIVAVKIPLLLACPVRCCPREQVVLGLAAANGASFVVGAVLGQVLLRRRLGRARHRPRAGTRWRTAVASRGRCRARLAGASLLVGPALPAVGPVAGAWLELAIAAVIGVLRVVAVMLVLRLPRVRELRRLVDGSGAPRRPGQSGRRALPLT